MRVGLPRAKYQKCVGLQRSEYQKWVSLARYVLRDTQTAYRTETGFFKDNILPKQGRQDLWIQVAGFSEHLQLFGWRASN